MATNVASSVEIPALTLSLARTRGCRNSVSTWLTMPTASSENGSNNTAASTTIDHERGKPPRASATKSAINAARLIEIDPK